MNTPKLTHEQIRAAGGIVHSDGNIFFTNIEKLNDAIAAIQAQAKPQPLSDDQIIAANYPDGEENGPTIAAPDFELVAFARQIEAAHGIVKE